MSDQNARERVVAIFVDVDNIYLSARDQGIIFEPKVVIDLALSEGRLMLARAYGDWREGWLKSVHTMMVAANFDLIQVVSDGNGKNTADLLMAIDALELTLLPLHKPDVVILASGDRDFVPLVKRLQRYGVEVLGLGVEGSIGAQFRKACNRFVSYQDLLGPLEGLPDLEEDLDTDQDEEAADAEALEPTSPTETFIEDPEEEEDVEEEEEEEEDDEEDDDEERDPVLKSPAELQAAMIRSMFESRLSLERESACQLLVKAVAALKRQNQLATSEALRQVCSRLDGSFSLERIQFSSMTTFLKYAVEHGVLRRLTHPDPSQESFELTPKGRELLGYEPKSPEDLARAYAKTLSRANVELLDKAWRDRLVTALFEELEDNPGTHTLGDLAGWLSDHARETDGFTASPNKFRKLVWSLNLFGCLKSEPDGRPRLGEQDFPAPAVSAERAIVLIEQSYVKKIQIEAPELEIQPEAIALFLYGSDGPEWVKEAIKRIENQQN